MNGKLKVTNKKKIINFKKKKKKKYKLYKQ